jgi:hypothetical protein
MFEPTPERAKAAKNSDVTVPNITINIPPNAFPQTQATTTAAPAVSGAVAHSPSPVPNVADMDWPSLVEFLQECSMRDVHHRDFGQHFECLQAQEIYGPDDIVRCNAAELQAIGLSLGTSKFLTSEASRVHKEVCSRYKRQRTE